MRSLLFFTTLIPIRLIAQQDTILIIYPTEPQTNDTIFINGSMDGHILFGTMALPLTSSQTALWSYSGLWLTSVKGSDCNGHDEDKMGIDKIESIWISDSSWIFSTQITSNCCHKVLGDASLESDSIINLSYIGYGGNCACYCCFGLTYTFKKDNEEWFTDYKWVMINNDRRTLIRIPEGRK
ncbi:MAG: hypothetical protein ACK44B_02470 [Flavobacteriales bacterium]